MFFKEIRFFTPGFELQETNVQDGKDEHQERWCRRQRSENEKNRQSINRVPNESIWAGKYQLRLLPGINPNPP